MDVDEEEDPTYKNYEENTNSRFFKFDEKITIENKSIHHSIL